MKTILSEIKNFKRLVKLVESDDKDVKVVLIGDQLTNYLNSNDFISTPNLRDDEMTIDKLLLRLSKQDKMPEVDHVFVSIGVNDKFQNKKTIPFLVDALDNIFPNAEIDIVKGIVGSDYFYGGEEVEDFKELENEILDYYNNFKQKGISVLGNYPSIDYGLGNSEKSISILKNQMSDSLYQNITNYGERVEPLSIDEPFIYKDNVDISGDDSTDFDTIYEFLDRFEEMVKSGNNYDSRVRNSFKPDIEQIQIALKFLLPNFDLEITGKYDTDTEEAIYKFQEQQGIESTGIANQETLEEILFDLKVKSFDDNDLSMFLKDESIFKDDLKIDDVLIDSGISAKVGSIHSQDESFYEEILDCIGAPNTGENKLFFYAWRQAEGAKAKFNPFNTTQPFGDDTKYNSVGVRNYETEEDGINATCKTLKNGHYPCIVDGLKSDIGAKNIAEKCLSNLKTWGTGELVFKVLNGGGSVNPPAIERGEKINIIKKMMS